MNTNPVVIRRIRGQLKKAGIIDVKRGLSGASLTRNPIDIDLLDIYRAVHINEELFRVHNNPNPECEVGRNIQSTLNSTFDEVQAKLENELKNITLDYVINKLQ
ncbi:Rrf2 family transcriptional regulator, group III [Bacillus sp. JCM 19047]|nr:Rrf2 family transcriptional regulator, group III [Bacillus sp. JCM 19047]